MPNYKFEVGDRVTVGPRAMVTIIRGKQGTIIDRQISLQDNVYDVAVDGHKSSATTGDYGIYEFNLEPESATPDPEQPQIFTDWQEAHENVRVRVNRSNRNVTISANIARYAPDNIFMKVGDGQNSYVTMSVEEAKAIAVALFNQILWHEQEAKNQ